jgi:uncharacterized membrane protein
MSLESSTDKAASFHTEHQIEVAAPIDVVYALISDVTRWPRVFGPTIHAERLELDGSAERIRLWATANGDIKTWVSERLLDAAGSRISFRQTVSQSPVAAMSGEWILRPGPDATTSVLLTHDYTPVQDVPGAREWIEQAVERNSTAELRALKRAAESAAAGNAALLTFQDSVRIAGPASAVYDFLYQAQRWEQLLPHVSRVVLREEVPGLQYLEMDTTAKDGSAHTTASVRIALPGNEIRYKQLVLPPLLSLHLGRWTITAEADGAVTATSEHTIEIDSSKLHLLGEGTDLDGAKSFVRGALGANSTATLMHAKSFAEAAGAQAAGAEGADRA